MFLNYSELEFNKDGRPEVPELELQTLNGDTIGTLSGVHNLKFLINFSEPSEIEFDIPIQLDNGIVNPLYDLVTGHKLIYTKHYGVYVIINPETESDGVKEVKHIKGYSLEKTLESKKFFIEEGTFKFYNELNSRDTNTIIGRILEIASGWSVGYIDQEIAQKYRTFEQYDDYLLSFMYNSAPEKYRCVFVFDTYAHTISVYNADGERPIHPIYLDYDNLLSEVNINEVSDELITAIRPYGADELDIRDVNPIGSNWIYDLSYFIEIGDISLELSNKYETWQRRILNRQEYFKGLMNLQASATTRLIAANATLTDYNAELSTLQSKQNIEIQAIANGDSSRQSELDRINAEIAATQTKIDNQKQVISDIEQELNPEHEGSTANLIQEVVRELSFNNTENFTEEEQETLKKYFIEQDITEDTFVASTIDTSITGINLNFSSGKAFNISESKISKIDLSSLSKSMYSIKGGKFETDVISCDIVRGTIEIDTTNNKAVLSIYGGSITSENARVSSGILTFSGTISNWSDDIQRKTEQEIVTHEGTTISGIMYGTIFVSANVSDYQKYSVQMELYEYAVGVLSDLSSPTYEFSVDSANFLFAKQFEPFRNELKLGDAVYLNTGHELINPIIIGIELSFENQSEFSLTFSNRFKRHDACNTLKDMIESSYSTSRTFDAGKYIYNQTVGQASMVSEFMKSSLDAAVRTIVGGQNQSININGAGISVTAGGAVLEDADLTPEEKARLENTQLRIANSMIAFTEDNWSTSKLAIGLFRPKDSSSYFGVNAEVIAGKLIVGNNLVIENEKVDSEGHPTGIMQFKVDSSGAWLNNSTFVLQKDDGGKILIDPKTGIAAGTGDLFTMDGTDITPSFINDDGEIIFDKNGMPKNSKFYLDINTGDAYFNGKIFSIEGDIGGWTIAYGDLHSGANSTYVAMNSDPNNLYAFWAGSSTPELAKFWVKKDGTMYAKEATFSGNVTASTLTGMLTGDLQSDENGALIGSEIYIPSRSNPVFKVDRQGNVTMTGAITWGDNKPSTYMVQYSVDGVSDWHDTMEANDKYKRESTDGGATWGAEYLIEVELPSYIQSTYIDSTIIKSPTIEGNNIGLYGGTFEVKDSTGSNLYGYIGKGTGNDGVGTTTGVIMAREGYSGLTDDSHYVIVTDRGARIQSGKCSIYATENGCYYNNGSGARPIGAAVFG